MNNLLFKLSAIAVLTSGLSLMPVYAADVEGTAAVPRTGDGVNAESEVYRASEVIGLPVKGDDGSEVGQIKDLVINGASREVLYAVVAMNQATEKDVVYIMPWTVFQPSFGQSNVIQYTTLTIPQTVWLQAPFFPMAQWRQTAYTQWAPRVNKYYSTHIRTGSDGINRPNSVQVNKPSLRDENGRDSAPQKPRVDAPKNNTPNNPSTDSPKADAPKNNDKPQATDPGRKLEAQPKPQVVPERKAADKPAVKDKELPIPNAPQLPSPKDTDPPEPKKPTPVPNAPKPRAPNPK